MFKKHSFMSSFFKMVLAAGILVVILVGGGCGSAKSPTSPASLDSSHTSQVSNSSVVSNPSTISGETEDELVSKGFLDSPDGLLRVSGKSQLKFSLKNMNNPPAAPVGWEIVGPVYDITARDRQNRAVRQLVNSLELQFKVDVLRPLTVLVYGDEGWEVVPSEVNSEGTLVAAINHLTPYTTGSPVINRTTVPTATPILTVAVPSAAITTSAVSIADAQNAMAKAAKSLKGKDVRITSAAGYTGSLYIALPPALQSSLGTALNSSGAAC